MTNDQGQKTSRIVGSIELGEVTPQLDQLPAPTTQTFSISGNLVSARYAYPLPGLKVSAYFVEPRDPTLAGEPGAPTQPHRNETLLGSAIADRNGSFQILFRDTPIVRQKMCMLTQFADSSVMLKVESTDGQLLYTSEPLNATSRSVVVTLSVPLPDANVTDDTWATLGARLEDARITQVNILAQQLATLDGPALFADWKLETRQAVLNQLEQAFLDPQNILRDVASPLPTMNSLRTPGTLEAFLERLRPQRENRHVREALADFVGKSQSFLDLFGIDWTMDLNAFRQGNVGLALNKFMSKYRAGIEKPIEILPLVETDLTRYRDYLRAIWTTWITQVEGPVSVKLSKQQAEDQLRNRFHQNFFTYDTSPQPANKVLIPILTEILTAPKGNTWGFGIASANIQPQDTRTLREYLNYLIGLTGLSARELGLRYRLDLTRPDSTFSSPVQENIATLQGFYRDSFQCDLEPIRVDPDVLNQPMVPDKLQGKAPFFLHFDEWLRQQSPFYPENFFDIRRTYVVEVGQSAKNKYDNPRDALTGLIKSAPTAQPRAEWEFVAIVWDISDKLNEGHRLYYLGDYGLALNRYLEAKGMLYKAILNKLVSSLDIESQLAARKQMSVKNMQELAAFMRPRYLELDYSYPGSDRDQMILALIYYGLYTIPVCLGDTYLALGDYEDAVFHYGQATRFAVGTARETDSGGYRPPGTFRLYHIGDRPYTANLHKNTYDEYPTEALDFYGALMPSRVEKLAVNLIAKYVHPVEARYFRLRQANAMLEWADALYRTSDSSSIQRARELYKGVSFLNRETPPICPEWPIDWGIVIPSFINQRENPALVSQKVRARKGFFQIDTGLNYYGESNDVVPPLRYRPLKQTADRFAALAKAAQQDFLLYMEQMERALIERMKLSTLLQKASLQASIAGEQIKIAEYNVTVAQEQVANVQDQIAAKEKEIADADSFFSQLGAFLGGVSNFVGGGVAVGKGGAEAADFFGYVTKDAIGAAGTQLGEEALLGVGWGGAAVVGGLAAFAAVGYMTMSSMADASYRRDVELRVLRERALPLAAGLVEAKQREVKIANYQQQIAQADIDLARDLISFEDNRFLNLNFWSNIAQIVKRIMRRYLELGTRVAWLAERALAYEQDRAINLIRLDYFPEKIQGVTGADLLQADLAELEATRVEGIKHSVPVKYTISLARDFPLQFGQLKQTGRCTFKTEELSLVLAYPGTMGYRVRAVSLLVSLAGPTDPLRGLLINQGISISHPGQPDEHVIVRPAEALPISEFKLQNDMAVYSLPDETLLTFEGSAVETFWEINLPAAANTFGYDGIADVLLTLDLWAQYSPDLYAKQLANMPKSVRRWIVVSGKQYQPDAIKDLAGVANTVKVNFDISAVKLPAREKNRKLKNVVIFFVSPSPLNVKALFSATQPATNVNISFKDGVTMSNLPPTLNDPVPPPLPLNALADFACDQRFTLTIVKTQNVGVDFSGVSDAVLGIEYAADLS